MRSRASRLTLVGLGIGLIGSVLLATPARAAAPPAPGSFTGRGFDTCVAPNQATMDTWNLTSPFSAVGVYVSGSSRLCGDDKQPNLNREWVARNARNGWRFLPIHVGRQAPCFAKNVKSAARKPRMSKRARTARRQARSEAQETITALKRYGFGKRSVAYLDIESYPRTTACDRIVLEFVGAWTRYLHARGYKSGLYSSGAAAIKAVDTARRAGREGLTPPDQLWFAWANGKADTQGGPFLSDQHWRKQRIHQYVLDTRVSYGGARVPIDKNFLDVGKGSVPGEPSTPCGVSETFERYAPLKVGDIGPQVTALECLLRRRGLLSSVDPYFGPSTVLALQAFRMSMGWGLRGTMTRPAWTALLAGGRHPRVLKQGSVGPSVWRLQRSLVTAGASPLLTGVYDARTVKAVQAYRRARGLPGYTTTEASVWAELQRGKTV
jgi:peptidoglycan hydrolase-like protein with peptidoglycan-binding domain